MRIFVKAKASAKVEKVGKIDDTHFVVAVKAPPREGKANQAVARALANHFHLPISRLQLVSGFSSKQKVFELA